MSAGLDRQLDRLAYLVMRVGLAAGYLAAAALRRLVRPSSRPSGVRLFSYHPRGTAGFAVRCGVYVERLTRDGLKPVLSEPGAAREVDRAWAPGAPRRRQYLYYLRAFWRRLGEVLAARRQHAAYVQRALFPYYPDQTQPHLERLLRVACPQVTLDFYDADYLSHPELVWRSLASADRVIVVNEHLRSVFAPRHPDVRVLPLAVDVEQYTAKVDYERHEPLRLLWSGSSVNAAKLAGIAEPLRQVSKEVPLVLVLVCPEAVAPPGFPVEHHPWHEEHFPELLRSADVGLYPAEDTERDRGKMAMKVLEYMAAGLPVVASPHGLTPHAQPGEHVLVAAGQGEWEDALRRLIADQTLREHIGRSAREMVKRFHSPEATYGRFRAIVLGEAEGAR